MAIETLVSAVKAWGERTFADRRAFESFKQSTEAALEGVGGFECEPVHVVNINGGKYIETTWDSSFSEVLSLIDDNKPLIVNLTYWANSLDFETVNLVGIRHGVSFVEFTFESSVYMNRYTFVADSDGELTLSADPIKYMPVGTYNFDILQYKLSGGGVWYATKPENMQFKTASGTYTTLSALEARVAALESAPA